MYQDRAGYYDISDYPDVMRYKFNNPVGANGKVAFEVKDKNGNKKRLGYVGLPIEEFVGLNVFDKDRG